MVKLKGDLLSGDRQDGLSVGTVEHSKGLLPTKQPTVASTPIVHAVPESIEPSIDIMASDSEGLLFLLLESRSLVLAAVGLGDALAGEELAERFLDPCVDCARDVLYTCPRSGKWCWRDRYFLGPDVHWSRRSLENALVDSSR